MAKVKRTKKTNKARWRKIGGGILKLNGESYRAGDTFYADEEDIPDGFMDLIELVEKPKPKKKKSSSKKTTNDNDDDKE